MKKLILIVAIVMSGMLAQAQMTIKNVTLGEIYWGDPIIHTTVAGIPGTIFVFKNEDIPYKIIYTPGIQSNGIVLKYVVVEQLQALLRGLTATYGVKFTRNNNYSYVGKIDGVSYTILSPMESGGMTRIVMTIQNDELAVKAKRVFTNADLRDF